MSLNHGSTLCCALVQIQAFDVTTKRQLQSKLSQLKKSEFRAAFVIQKEDEPNLALLLESMKFQKIAQFHRRPEYQDERLLTMWIKSW